MRTRILLLLLPLRRCALALAGCRSLPPSKPESLWTPRRGRERRYIAKCGKCHYPTNTRPLNGPGLQALTKVKAMPSGAPPTDERLTEVILHGRGMMPATPLTTSSSAICWPTCTRYDRRTAQQTPKFRRRGRNLLPLPGLAAIASTCCAGRGHHCRRGGGRHYPPLFLIFAAVFVTASAGLLVLFRWAWALALSAVFLLVVYNLWIFAGQHPGAGAGAGPPQSGVLPLPDSAGGAGAAAVALHRQPAAITPEASFIDATRFPDGLAAPVRRQAQSGRAARRRL